MSEKPRLTKKGQRASLRAEEKYLNSLKKHGSQFDPPYMKEGRKKRKKRKK